MQIGPILLLALGASLVCRLIVVLLLPEATDVRGFLVKWIALAAALFIIMSGPLVIGR